MAFSKARLRRGRVQKYGAESHRFDTYLLREGSLSKTLYAPHIIGLCIQEGAHYENTPMQYTENFEVVKIDKF